MRRIVAVFCWGASEALIPAAVPQSLAIIPGLLDEPVDVVVLVGCDCRCLAGAVGLLVAKLILRDVLIPFFVAIHERYSENANS